MKNFLKSLHHRIVNSWKSTVFGCIVLFSSIFTGILLYQEKVTFDELSNFMISLPSIVTAIVGVWAIFHKEPPKVL